MARAVFARLTDIYYIYVIYFSPFSDVDERKRRTDGSDRSCGTRRFVSFPSTLSLHNNIIFTAGADQHAFNYGG